MSGGLLLAGLVVGLHGPLTAPHAVGMAPPALRTVSCSGLALPRPLPGNCQDDRNAVGSAVTVPPANDVVRVIQTLAAIADPLRQSDEIEAQVASVPRADLSMWAGALTDARLPEPCSEFRDRVIRRWAAEHPVAAAHWAEQLSASALRQTALTQVALAWVERDASQATTWAATLADDVRGTVQVTLGYEIARTDPVEALALAVALSPGRDRDDLMVHAASQWASTDALAATEWACACPDLALRERVLAAIATAMADQDPASAVLLTTQALWPGESQKQAAMAIVQRWAQRDSAATASWVQQFPADELKDTALRYLTAMESPPGETAVASPDAF